MNVTALRVGCYLSLVSDLLGAVEAVRSANAMALFWIVGSALAVFTMLNLLRIIASYQRDALRAKWDAEEARA